MIRRPPRSTLSSSSAASDVYKRQVGTRFPQGGAMPKYLLEVNYTLDGVKGLAAEGGTARVAAATALVESLGGKVESFYFAFGDTDAYVVIDLPNNSSAAGGALAVDIGGGAT